MAHCRTDSKERKASFYSPAVSLFGQVCMLRCPGSALLDATRGCPACARVGAGSAGTGRCEGSARQAGAAPSSVQVSG